jgi:hypothetical protein
MVVPNGMGRKCGEETTAEEAAATIYPSWQR